jgi:ADP-dependent phosphofructokinase/glucokinase
MYTIKLNDRFLSRYTISNTYTTSASKPIIYLTLKEANEKFNSIKNRANNYIVSNLETIEYQNNQISTYNQQVTSIREEIKRLVAKPYIEVSHKMGTLNDQLRYKTREIKDCKESITYHKTEMTKIRTFLNNNFHIAVLTDRPLGAEDAFDILKLTE